MSALAKLFLTLLFCALFLALPSTTYAESFVVTSGYAFGGGVGPGNTYYRLSGTDFDIRGVDIDGGVLNLGCTPCQAGVVNSFNANISTTYGSATINVDGIAYKNVAIGGQLEFTVNNMTPVPLTFSDFTITTPFTFRATIAGYSDDAKEHQIFLVHFNGQGLVTVWHRFHYIQNGIPIFERGTATYNFNSDPAPPLSELKGRVVMPDGTPMRGLSLFITGSGINRTVVTDNNGNYVFQGLAINRFYRVSVNKLGYRFEPSLPLQPFYDIVLSSDQTLNFTAIPTFNPIDMDYFFVSQQYRDFLNREPDNGGLNYWRTQLHSCSSDRDCNQKRVNVAAAFFVEPEFQQTGFFITRIYKAALGRQPSYAEFTADRGRLVVGSNLGPTKQAFADEFTQRTAFQSLYPDSLSNENFVNKLFDTANLRPYVAERQARIVALYSHAETRAEVLRDVAEFEEFKAREYDPSFVLMQYFGYLRRDPDEAGYDFWLNVLNSQPNNYKGMVCAFITSEEYQKRFSPLVTHSNAECGP